MILKQDLKDDKHCAIIICNKEDQETANNADDEDECSDISESESNHAQNVISMVRKDPNLSEAEKREIIRKQREIIRLQFEAAAPSNNNRFGYREPTPVRRRKFQIEVRPKSTDKLAKLEANTNRLAKVYGYRGLEGSP